MLNPNYLKQKNTISDNLVRGLNEGVQSLATIYNDACDYLNKATEKTVETTTKTLGNLVKTGYALTKGTVQGILTPFAIYSQGKKLGDNLIALEENSNNKWDSQKAMSREEKNQRLLECGAQTLTVILGYSLALTETAMTGGLGTFAKVAVATNIADVGIQYCKKNDVLGKAKGLYFKTAEKVHDITDKISKAYKNSGLQKSVNFSRGLTHGLWAVKNHIKKNKNKN